MSVRKLIILGIMFFCTHAVADFRTEFSYDIGTFDDDNDLEFLNHTVGGTLFITPVSSSDVPYAVAGFLSKSSSISASYSFIDYDSDELAENEVSGYTIDVRWVTRDDLILGGSFAVLTDEYSLNDGNFSSEVETQNFSLKAGTYLEKGVSLETIIGRSNTEYSFSSTFTDPDLEGGSFSVTDIGSGGLLSGLIDPDTSSEAGFNYVDFSVNVAMPVNTGGYTHASLNVIKTFSEDFVGFIDVGFNATYYFSKSLGLLYEIGYQEYDESSIDFIRYSIGIEKFLGENFASFFKIGYVDVSGLVDAIPIQFGLKARI